VAPSDTSIEEIKERCDKNPTDLGGALELMQRYCEVGRYDEALGFCRAAMKHHSRAYSFLLQFANVLFRRSDFKEARMLFKRLTEFKPDRVEAWNNLGMLEFSVGRLEEANSAFAKVLELEPQNAGALCNTGNYYAEKGDAALAATYFERALAVRSDFTEAWYNLGNSYMSLNRFEPAKEAFEKAISCDGRFGSAYKNLGFVCERLGDHAAALERYGQAAALNKSDAGVQVNMAGIYMELKQYDKALECGRRAASLAPGETSSWNALRKAAIQLCDGQSYHRAVTALISGIGDNDLAVSISDLRDMGFELEAEELLEYTVKIHRSGSSVDALPFAESKAPPLPEGASDKKTYKIINKKSPASGGGKGGRKAGRV
jgi:tetratricopeptide (TPR) repeat protein